MRQEMTSLGRTAMRQDKPWGYGVMIIAVAAALVSLFYNSKVGVYVTVGALALLLAMAARDAIKRRLLLLAAIIPLLGMINLSFTCASALGQTTILYASMLVLALIYRRLWKTEIITPAGAVVGTRLRKATIPIAVVASLLTGLLAARLLSTGYVFGGTALWRVVVVAILGAAAEESLFRGLIQRQATQLMRPLYAVGLTCLLYLPLCFNHFSGWSLLIGALTSAILSATYAIKPNLLLTGTLNLTTKLVYLFVTAAVIFR